jgi:hypothetical protein
MLKTDVPKHADAIFIGLEGKDIGKVVAGAGPVGQLAIEQLFPGCHVGWREIDALDELVLPADWREFCFVVSALVKLPNHGLNRHLLGLRSLKKMSPDQFAFLMSFSTNNPSVRIMFWSIARQQFQQVNMPSQHN